MAWSVKNYNAWIKQARRASGVTLAEARQAYRIERDKRGGPLRGVDVGRSRTFKDSVTAAQVREAKASVKIRNRREVESSGGGGGGGFSGGGSAGSGISVSSVSAWDDIYDDFDNYEPFELESSADYSGE